MAEKGSKLYWSDDGQICFVDNRGYGIAPDGATVDIGKEADILKAFATGEIANDLCPDRRLILEQILEYRKEGENNGDTRHRAGKASLERGRFTRPLGAKAGTVRQTKTRAGLPLRVFKSKK